MFELVNNALGGVLVIKPRVFRDARGFFMESYHQAKFADNLGIRDHFVQDNHSCSHQHTLRGLHFQVRHPQAKLCRVVRGEVLDVAVDIRRGSPTFGQWASTVLSADNKHQVYVPAGFAHGFVVLSEEAEFVYKCSDYYDPAGELGIHWADSQLAIDWQVSDPILSDKDSHYPPLARIPPDSLPVFQRS
jgi:dTDP-4-dehydrorhamnose 3,5-epimerase